MYILGLRVKDSYSISKIEHAVGAGRHCLLDGFGEIDEYVTEWHEGTGFVYDVSALGPLHQSFSCWWLTKVSHDVTRLSVNLSYNLRFGLFGKIMHRLIMRKKLEQSLPQTLESMKQRVETGKLYRPLIQRPAFVG